MLHSLENGSRRLWRRILTLQIVEQGMSSNIFLANSMELEVQTEHAFSTTEAEYVALSQALREVMPISEILKELKEASFEYNTTIPMVHCKAFEDNTGAVEMARLPKMRPRMKGMKM
jgi:hypothetical protein